MTPESVPILSYSVAIESSGRTTTLTSAALGWRFAISGRQAKRMGAALKMLDGTHTVEHVATLTNTPCSDLLTVLRALSSRGLCIDTTLADVDVSMPAQTLARHCDFAAQNIFAQPFWTECRAGRLSTACVLGWGIEFFHFVDAANEYMPLGVASTDGTPAIREVLARHYCEEAHHAAIFLDGLEQSGLSRSAVIASPALPTTTALINHLKEVASQGYLRYSLMFAVMQPSGGRLTRRQTIEHYQSLGRHYPTARPLFRAFAKHAMIDLGLNHNRPSFYKFVDNAAPGSTVIARLVELVHLLAESFIFFFEGIHQHYSSKDVVFPRRRLSASEL